MTIGAVRIDLSPSLKHQGPYLSCKLARSIIVAYKTVHVDVDVAMKGHNSRIVFYVIISPSHPMVFRIPLLEKYNPHVGKSLLSRDHL